MKALLYRDWGCVEIAEMPDPAPGKGELLVRVEACGICGSELECVAKRLPRRTPPLILGHEFCGKVAALGEGVSGFTVGDAVLVNSVIPCGQCHACRRGESNLCRERKVFGMHRPGGCAELVAAPTSVVYRRPADMDPLLGALVEPAANAVHAMKLLPDRAKETVFVFGAGLIGLMAMQAARALLGARTAVADLRRGRLECALELGAETVVNPNEAEVVEAGIAFSKADGVDYVVDAVGTAETKRQSLAIARPNGVVCWLGLLENEIQLNSYDVTQPQKLITGSYAFVEEEFLEAAQLLCAGRMAPGRSVKSFPLTDAVEAFERMSRGEADDIRAVIMP